MDHSGLLVEIIYVDCPVHRDEFWLPMDLISSLNPDSLVCLDPFLRHLKLFVNLDLCQVWHHWHFEAYYPVDSISDPLEHSVYFLVSYYSPFLFCLFSGSERRRIIV